MTHERYEEIEVNLTNAGLLLSWGDEIGSFIASACLSKEFVPGVSSEELCEWEREFKNLKREERREREKRE